MQTQSQNEGGRPTIAGGRSRELRDRCKTWVATMMLDGPQLAKNIEDLGKAQGFFIDTLRRVKKELGLKSKQAYDSNGSRIWYWVYNLTDPLPETPTTLEPDMPEEAQTMSESKLIDAACTIFGNQAITNGDP